MIKLQSFTPVLTHLGNLLILFLAVVGVMLVYKGEIQNGVLLYQTGIDSSVGTPFESTNSTARYVLTQAIVENRSFLLDEQQARSSSPDVVKYQERYFSLFTPGVSLLAAPLYLLGKYLGAPQAIAYLFNCIVAMVNVVLLMRLARRAGASTIAGWLAGLIFLFATNALVYALTLTQHHVTVTLILASLLLVLHERSIMRNLLLGAMYAVGVLVDIPNAFLMMPTLLYGLGQHLSIDVVRTNFVAKIHGVGIWIIIGAIPFALFFAYYNHSLTGSYTKLGQFIGRYTFEDANRIKKQTTDDPLQSARVAGGSRISLPFQTRLQLEGAHILLLSKQRSWLYYSPVVLVGIVGVLLLLHDASKRKLATLLIATILMNIVLYASFGDPWGGWSFGPRYLIPSAALLCLCLAVCLRWAARFRLLMAFGALVMIPLLWLSVSTTTLGALTTAAIPPRGEAEALQNDTPWDTEYNERFLEKNDTTSLFYDAFVDPSVVSAQQYYESVRVFYASVLIALLLVVLYVESQSWKRNYQ